MKKIILLIFIALSFNSYSQDVIKVMHYNLMYYNQTSSYCTSSNNALATKDAALKKIIEYVRPDIFTANEVAPLTTAHQHILDNILNINGITYYKKGTMSNLSGSDLSNCMFYNSNKLTLLSQKNISTTVRDINIYNFYYKAYNLGTTHDTAYLTCIIMHLKAGNTASDASERAVQTNKLMTYLNSLNKKANYLLMGDFNVYASAEECFQNLINYSNTNIRFYDPINKLGSWNSNYSYAKYHTQSTHTTSTGCFATGGLDDRFDFILESEYIKNGTDHFQYVNASYKTVGQDGSHLNKAVNYGTNNSAPDSIISALYDMSDHLPVVMNLSINQTAGVDEYESGALLVNFPNPVAGKIALSIYSNTPKQLDISIIDMLGRTLYSCHKENNGTWCNYDIPTEFLKHGLYFIRVSDGKYKAVTKKFILE